MLDRRSRLLYHPTVTPVTDRKRDEESPSMTEQDDDATPDGNRDRTRDRAATERRILDAAEAILVESGPSGFGVNVLARSAGVDKQLIYRYFGGLDGLLEALGERIAVWWQDRLGEDVPKEPPETYGVLIERLALRLLKIMRTEPLAIQTALWELTDSSGLVRKLASARARALQAWLAEARGGLSPREGVDAAAVNALVVSALSYACLSARASGNLVGLDADDPKTWHRIEQALIKIVRSIY